MRSKDSCPVWGEGAGKVPDRQLADALLYVTYGSRSARRCKSSAQLVRCLSASAARCINYLWRAVDQHGVVLDIPVQSRRSAKAARRFFRKLILVANSA